MRTVSKPVVLVGTGPTATLAHYYLSYDSPYEVVGFAVLRQGIEPGVKFGLPVVPLDEVTDHFPVDRFSMFVAVGSGRSSKLRAATYRQAKAIGYDLVSYVSSTATMWPDSAVGDNCFIMERNVIQPFAEIGNDVIMWGGCQVGLGATIGDHTFLGALAVVSDMVTVEEGCVIGENATIGAGVTLGRESVIGAGALVLTGTRPRQVREGHEAKLLPIPSDRLLSI